MIAKVEQVALKAVSDLLSEHRVLKSSEAKSIGSMDVSGGRNEKALLRVLVMLQLVTDDKTKSLHGQYPALAEHLSNVWEALGACLDIVKTIGYPETENKSDDRSSNSDNKKEEVNL